MAAPTQLLMRVALVTGAAQGIGRSIALRLAKDGLKVAVVDLPSKRQQLDNVVSEIESGNTTNRPGSPQALAVTADVSSERDVQAMVTSTAERLGGLDVVSGHGYDGHAHPCNTFLRQMVANAGIIAFGELVDSARGFPACRLRTKSYAPSAPTEEWEKVMNVNLRGVMLSYKYAALQMIQQGRGGRIIGEL